MVWNLQVAKGNVAVMALVQPQQPKPFQSRYCPKLNWKRNTANIPQCLTSKTHRAVEHLWEGSCSGLCSSALQLSQQKKVEALQQVPCAAAGWMMNCS